MDQEQTNETITIRVEHGETLSEIANRYSISIEELQHWNRIENPDFIQADQKIIVHTAPEALSDIWITGIVVLILALWFLRKRKVNAITSGNFVQEDTFPWHDIPDAVTEIPITSEQPVEDYSVRPVSVSYSKGEHGEQLVNEWLNEQYPEWILLNNILIPSGKNTTQIDHILISPWAVFLIETKNMDGWIFGSPGRKQWTQSFASTRQSYLTETKSIQFKFYNPLLQNEGHTKNFLKLDILNYPWIRPIVVFTGDADLKTKDKFLPYEQHEKIANQNQKWRIRGVICMNLKDLQDYISLSVARSPNPPLTRQKMEAISAKIKNNEIPWTTDTQKRHNYFVQSLKEESARNKI